MISHSPVVRRIAIGILGVWLALPGNVAWAQEENIQQLVQMMQDINARILASQFKEAEPQVKRFVEFAEKNFRDDVAVRIMASALAASVYDLQGKYVDEEPHLQRVLFLVPYLDESSEEAIHALKSLQMAALAYQGQRRFVESEKLYRKALAVSEAARSEPTEVINSLIFLGIAAQAQAHYPEAEVYFRRAMAVGESAGLTQNDYYVMAVLALGNSLMSQDRLAEALPLAQRALSICEQNPGASLHLSDALENLASIYERQGKFDDAEPLLRRKLAATESQNLMLKPAFLASRKQDIARLNRLRKKYGDAEALLKQIVADLEREYGAGNSYLSSPLMELARVYQDQQRYEDALREVEQAAALSTKNSPEILLFRAKLHGAMNNKEAALDDARAAMERVEEARGLGSGGEIDRARLFAKYDDIYETLVNWLIEDGNITEAFSVAERFRARSLIDQLDLQGVDLLAGLPQSEAYQLRWKESVTKAQIATIERQITDLEKNNSPSSEQQSARKRELTAQLTQAQQNYLEAYREVRNASPAYRLAVSKNFQPVSLDEVQQWADGRKALILEYIVGRDQSHLIVIGPQSGAASLHKLSLDAAAASRLGASAGELTAERLQSILMNAKKTGVLDQLRNEAQPPPFDKLAALYDVVIPAEVRSLLLSDAVELVVVIPHGPLGLFPFEALVTETGEVPRYLLDVAPPVVYAPSATVLLGLSARPQAGNPASPTPVLTVGDPQYSAAANASSRGTMAQLAPKSRYAVAGGQLAALPHSGLESKWISEVFAREGMTSTRLAKAEATEAKVRGQVANRQIVHLACHGLADQSYGNLFGALAFSPGQNSNTSADDDGFLTLAEIYQLDLKQCELAILSACDTNFGPQQRGEGTWTLSRGFLAAGAQRVVASNWLVDDEAAANLISYFCGGVARDRKAHKPGTCAQRLLAAKRWVREQPKWSSPYYWAPFVMVGPN